MAPNQSVPPVPGGAGRGHNGAGSQAGNTLDALRVQAIIIRAGVAPPMAATLAKFAFGGRRD